MGFATVDLDRERRTGFPEVVMGEGKTPEHIAEIAKRIYDASGMVLVTRSNRGAAEAVKAVVPTASFIEILAVRSGRMIAGWRRSMRGWLSCRPGRLIWRWRTRRRLWRS